MTTVNTNQVSQDILDAVNKKNSSKGSNVDEAQDRFMTLLVTQMKNQDPLNPMDNAQVTSQMAQLNTVTGINKLNETMSSLISSVQLGQSYQATSMIGHSVLVSGNNLTHAEAGGYFGVNVPNGADTVSVNIKDGAGQIVRTLSFGKQEVGVNALSWDGKNNEGVVAPSGNYTYEITAKIGDTTTTSSPLSLAQVQSVSNSTSGIKLNLSNNTAVAVSDVVEIF
ncbi:MULTISPECIES: flagellar hook assembly protein FlgD [unclassified Methylophilus]|jgi:flagellar basal-body rod modification protein FlgD|uniref:flagellar hook assembly protein FlgD n=1 Tax=unclassified Methylophilus TaxID=2630143 RepID=UPI0007008E49|nr:MULTISPECIES: flagellar hook assembly protein FlgD [unclassified Methylophilus]KQT37198.1 flagellar biosynthesis protein FlgD [Methylophilus sp. Leaf416]KQT55632.1 flagellar biosynthesis protein FlgD [Methylophilus sp. Leaf459]